MPTPSSNPSNPPSPPSRFHAFPSCPDPEDAPAPPEPSQSAASDASAAPSPPSSWRPLSPPPTYPADGGRGPLRTERAEEGGDSRSVTMSPGPQAEDDATRDDGVVLGQEPEGMVMAVREEGAERHKPGDTDEEVSPVGEGFASRGGGGSGGEGGRGGARGVLGETSGRRKARAEQGSPVVGEIHELDVWGPAGKGPRWVEDSGLVGLGLEYSHMRVIPTAPSLYLQPGSRFVGTQQSERQQYEVEVEIKHVDMRESFLCGYLKIQGRSHPLPGPWNFPG